MAVLRGAYLPLAAVSDFSPPPSAVSALPAGHSQSYELPEKGRERAGQGEVGQGGGSGGGGRIR